MDRIWQWAWGRFGARYSWALYALTLPVMLAIYPVLTFAVVAFEGSDHYVEAGVITAVAVPVLVYVMILPGLGPARLMEQWAAGQEVDRIKALEATYTWTRWAVPRAVSVNAAWAALLCVGVGAVAGAAGWRMVQYAILGALLGTAVQLIAVHSFPEALLRPARVAIAGDTDIGASPALAQLSRPGPTSPCSRRCSHMRSWARWWRRRSIGQARYLFSPS